MSDDEENGPYTDSHRAFLQSLLSRQTITYDQAKPLIAAIQTAANPERPTLAEDVTPEDFEEYTHTINAALSPFDFEIRSSLHQTSKQRIYALVNTTSDALTQMATVHTPDEIAFVKRVLDAMFDTYNTQRAEVMAVTSMQALKLAKGDRERRESGGQSQSQGLTMAQAEKVLEALVDEGWFDKSASGFYSLTPRALMELRTWLVDTYNEQDEEEEEEDDEEDGERVVKIKSCAACRDIVTVGQRCPNLPCNLRLHDHCVRNMFRARQNNEQCPECKTEWKDAPPVGEKASKHAGAGRRTTNGSAARRSIAMTNGVAEESDASDDAE